MLTRRDTLLGAAALGACAPVEPRAAYTPPPNDPRFAAIEERIGGRVGVAAWNTGTGDWLGHRLQERFAMCSTFKWLLAAQHLRMNDETPGWLAEVMQFGPADLLEHAPTAREHVAQGYMSNEQMCQGAVVLSDNTCANLLLVPAGGPPGLTAFLRANGDGLTRLDRTEPTLNENLPGDDRDTTTPDAMIRTLQRFLLTDTVLSAASRERLIGWMIASPTGRLRLRAGLPSTWRVGDKTGTWNGEHDATNDVAIAWPPSGAPILIAAYLSDSNVNLAARSEAHILIGRIIAEEWG
ncbi:MAG: class A beta-lactamase [Terricaulis sp.]